MAIMAILDFFISYINLLTNTGTESLLFIIKVAVDFPGILVVMYMYVRGHVYVC